MQTECVSATLSVLASIETSARGAALGVRRRGDGLKRGEDARPERRGVSGAGAVGGNRGFEGEARGAASA